MCDAMEWDSITKTWIIYIILTAKSPYSSTQIKGSSKQQPPKPAARNMWITAMRNGTASK